MCPWDSQFQNPKLNTVWLSDAKWCWWSLSKLFRWWIVTSLVPNHYLNQCWLNINEAWWHLTHWDWVTHICISKLTTIGSDNGLSPGQCQAITWNSTGILSIRPLQANISEILIGIQTFSFKKIHLKMSSAKWHPFCLNLNVLRWLHRKCSRYHSLQSD